MLFVAFQTTDLYPGVNTLFAKGRIIWIFNDIKHSILNNVFIKVFD